MVFFSKRWEEKVSFQRMSFIGLVAIAPKNIIPPKSWTTPLVWFTSDSGWHIIKQREEER